MGNLQPIPGMSPKLRVSFQRVISKSLEAKKSPGRRRAYSADSTHSNHSSEGDPWGWFEDVEQPHMMYSEQPLTRALSLPPPATEPPVYILESSIAAQHLWYATAGQRPKQPVHEREYYERLWAQNFQMSAVEYTVPVPKGDGESKAACDDENINDVEGDVLFKGKGAFSNSVSKSFVGQSVRSMTIQLPRFRIRRCPNGEVHAEFLVVVSLGGSHSTMTFGVWRRHSDFSKLAMEIYDLDLKSRQANSFKNALLSWQCLLHRKRWFRCLDKDYLALKCFLLERFMHDVLFESQSPGLISGFLELD